jgi:RNA polymerase sigma factor (sigma-70 family)
MEDDFDNWLAARGKEVPEDDGRLLPGTVVGDYRIVALLGRGGFAEVYRASSKDGEPVAIKMLHRLDDKSRARFARESEILLQIKHRNIPRLLSFGSCGDRPYMVTELLKGCELPSSDHEILRFMEQIISAVMELPETLRTAVELHYFEGLTAKETASLLRTSEAAVYMRLARGRSLLREKLEGDTDL